MPHCLPAPSSNKPAQSRTGSLKPCASLFQRIGSNGSGFFVGLSGSQTRVVVFALRKHRRRAQRQATASFARRGWAIRKVPAARANRVAAQPGPPNNGLSTGQTRFFAFARCAILAGVSLDVFDQTI
jgi:hypothetical protein